MSWLRGALQRAADGSKSNLGRARTFAGSVVLNAGTAVGRAKAVLERANLSGKSYNNFHHAVRRLDEVSLSARGAERVQALARWLGALRELDRGAGAGEARRALSQGVAPEGEGEGAAEGEEGISDPSARSGAAKEEGAAPRTGSTGAEQEGGEDKGGTQQSSGESSSRGVSTVLFYDPELSSEALTFRDVFLRSNALQNITVSLILDPPQDEEVKMLLEMFGLCLAGGPEVHHAILSGLQDLGRASANYTELRTKREALLQVAAECITGLKLSAEVERLDGEALRTEAEMSAKMAGLTLKDAPAEKPEAPAPSEGSQGVLKDVPAELQEGAAASEELLQLGARLVELLERKKALVRQGDTEEGRRKKVEQVRALGEELASALKEHKQTITASRKQKSDAMAYRVTKAEEVQETEKVIAQEMQALQRRKEELEAQLKEVLQAISVQTMRHIQLQEEKEAFDEASSNIVAHLAAQEDELSRLISHHTADIGAACTWQSFLEDTWRLQHSCQEEKEKAVREALEASRKHFWQVAIGHLVYRQEELAAHLIRLKMYDEELSCMRSKKAELEKQGLGDADGALAEVMSNRRKIEAAYVRTEARVKDTLVAVERAKAELKAAKEAVPSSADSDGVGEAAGGERTRVAELLASLDVARRDFDALKRPKLDSELHSASSAQHQQQRLRKGGAAKSSEAWGSQGVRGADKLTPLPPLPGGAVRGGAGTAPTSKGAPAQTPGPPHGGEAADVTAARAGSSSSSGAGAQESGGGGEGTAPGEHGPGGQGGAQQAQGADESDGWEGFDEGEGPVAAESAMSREDPGSETGSVQGVNWEAHAGQGESSAADSCRGGGGTDARLQGALFPFS
eukprot:TRINITY_DN4014_c0_g2_i1.p1 TRINITY_DN4014_c0_g2~~TRINITY_DN4014_c0_g2_i1.p1  ORF type:complete len:859 (-),score=275.83 TRINITY_DN4014_c0_g2_i1:1017-3593(-)